LNGGIYGEDCQVDWGLGIRDWGRGENNITDIRYIQELLEHASIMITERYTHVAKRKTLSITSPLDTIDKED